MNPTYSQDIDLSKYKITIPSSDSSLDPEYDQDVDLNKYRSKEPIQIPEPARHAVRTGSRIGETIGGFLGDTREFSERLGKGIGQYIGEKARKAIGKPPLSEEQKKDIEEKIKKEKNIFQKGLEFLPTSSQLKDFSSQITKGFTDPQSAEEELADDIVSLGAVILMGNKDPTKFQSLMKSLGLSSLATGARVGAEKFGAEEKGQAAAEVGTLFLTSLLSKRFADKFISDKYKKAASLVPEGTMVNTESLETGLNRVETDLKKGLTSSSSTKSEVLRSVNELQNKISGGSIPLEELVESYHDINEKLSSKKLFNELSKSEKIKLKSRYDKLKTEVHDSISDYGKYNPKFFQEWKSANQAYATLAQSRTAKDFILSNMKSIPGHIATGLAVKLLLGVPALAAAGGGFAAFQAGKILNRVVRNPSLREYYLNTLRASTEENLPALISNLKKLEDGLKEEE